MNLLHRFLPMFLVACSLLSAAGVFAQPGGTEILNFEEAMIIDHKGDGKMSITITLTAKQFINWKQKYGNNPSLLKRDMSKYYTQYDASNFDLKQNDLDRKIEISLNARGMVRHLGGGQYEMKVDKAWKAGDRTGYVYSFNYNQTISPGVLAQHKVKVTLPEDSYNFQDQLSEGGEKLIKYRVPLPGGRSLTLLAGIAAGIVALLCLIVGMIPTRPTPATTPAT